MFISDLFALLSPVYVESLFIYVKNWSLYFYIYIGFWLLPNSVSPGAAVSAPKSAVFEFIKVQLCFCVSQWFGHCNVWPPLLRKLKCWKQTLGWVQWGARLTEWVEIIGDHTMFIYLAIKWCLGSERPKVAKKWNVGNLFLWEVWGKIVNVKVKPIKLRWVWWSFSCLGSSLKGVDPKDMQSFVDCISFGPVGVWNVEMAKSSG